MANRLCELPPNFKTDLQYCSKELKSLLNSLLTPKAETRPTAAQALGH